MKFPPPTRGTVAPSGVLYGALQQHVQRPIRQRLANRIYVAQPDGQDFDQVVAAAVSPAHYRKVGTGNFESLPGRVEHVGPGGYTRRERILAAPVERHS